MGTHLGLAPIGTLLKSQADIQNNKKGAKSLSYFSFMSLPREPKSYHMSAFTCQLMELCANHPLLLHINSPYSYIDPASIQFHFPPGTTIDEGYVGIFKSHFVNKADYFPKGCFDNQALYEYHVYRVDDHAEKRMEIANRYIAEEAMTGKLDIEAMHYEMRQYSDFYSVQHFRVLHGFLHANLSTGESVELYTVLDDGMYPFPMPKSIYSANLKELLIPRAMDDYLSKKGCKLIIHKTD